MGRRCKILALVVGWSGLTAAAWAQDASPAPPPPARSSILSIFKRNKSQEIADPGSAPASPQFPTPPGPAPQLPPQQTGAPPLPPFVPPQMPPAEAPPAPDGVPNGFTDPLPPDALNGFEPNPPDPDPIRSRPFYFGAEYLHWWVQKQPVPALATTGDATDPVPGAFGQPHTAMYLDDVSNSGAHEGVRLTAGYDFDRDGILGVDARWFWLNYTGANATVGGDGSANSPVITRPFFNTVTRKQDADPINIPGVISGYMNVQTPLRMMGADANVRWLVNNSPINGPRFTLLAGVRWVAIDEKLLISEGLADVSGVGTVGNRYSLNENFSTYNRFYGGQVGFSFDHHIGPVALQVVSKFAYGRTQEVLKISGYTTATEPSGAVSSSQAGLYTGPGNNGRYSDGEWAFLPEGEFKIGYEFNEYVRFNVGYDVLYISRIIRPAKQIVSDVNIQPLGTTPVGPLDPHFAPFRNSGLWAQGLTFGLEFNF